MLASPAPLRRKAAPGNFARGNPPIRQFLCPVRRHRSLEPVQTAELASPELAPFRIPSA
jgi:hypothetical protein